MLTTVTDITSYNITSTDKKMSTALVLLNFSKAFDHELLLVKLKYYGFLNHSVDRTYKILK